MRSRGPGPPHSMARRRRLCWQIAGLIRVPAARQVAQQADIGGPETGIDSLSLAGLARPTSSCSTCTWRTCKANRY